MGESAHSVQRPAPELFLSYSSADQGAVVRVQRLLQAKGVSTFLDRTNLEPGMPWVQVLEEALRRARGMAVFLGPGGLGTWQRRELWWALDRQARAEAAGERFPVIPVLLPGMQLEAAPGFLLLNMWVDLRQDLEDAAGLDALARAVDGGPVPSPPPTVLQGLCPYRGLHAFREEDSPLFFGREAFAEELFRKVEVERLKLVAVVGPSGSGKSSVVQAGLLPLLRRTRPPQASWDAVTFKPGRHPFRNLAAALVPLLEPQASPVEQLQLVGDIASSLEAQEAHKVLLSEVVTRVLKENPGTERLLLVVDQFEELFTLAPEAVRQPFLAALLEAAEAAACTVLLTVRADYYGQVIGAHRGLSDLLRDGHVPLGPLLPEELQRVITKPAERFAVRFEPGLAERILKDVALEPGGLPLLEFALTQLWQERKGAVISNVQYGDDTLKTSISHRATEQLKLLPAAQRELAMRGMTRLVRVVTASEEGAATRQRVLLGQLDEATRKALAPFVDARLLVVDRHAATGEETVEVAHEALIRTWAQLRERLEKDRDFLLWRQQLAPLLDTWQRAPQKDEALLPGFLLKEAGDWLKTREQELSEAERAFIRQSVRKNGAKRRARVWAVRIGAGLAGITLAGTVPYVAWTRTEHYQLRALSRLSVDTIAVDFMYTRHVPRWVRALSRAGMTSEAIAAARKIKEHQERGAALFVVAGELARTADAGRAQELMRAGLRYGDELTDEHLEAIGVFTERQARSGSAEGLDFMLVPLRERSSWQQAAFHVTRLQGLRRGGATAQARRAFEDARFSIKRAADESDWRASGDVYEFILVLEAEARYLEAQTELTQALEYAAEKARMTDWSGKDKDADVPLALAYGLSLLGEPDSSTRLLEKVLPVVPRWGSENSRHLKELAERLGSSGMASRMLALARVLKSSKGNVKLVIDVAVGLMRARQMEGLPALLEELKVFGRGQSFDLKAVNVCLRELINAGELEGARRLFRKALPGFADAPGSVNSEETFMLARWVFELDEVELVLARTNEGWPPESYNPYYGEAPSLLGKALLLEYTLAQVAETYGAARALQLVERINDKRIQAGIRARLATVLARQGELAKASELMREALAELGKPEHPAASRDPFLIEIASALAREGAIDLALEVTHLLGPNAMQDAHEKMASALAAQGRAEQAFKLLAKEKFASDVVYSDARASVLAALARAGQTEAALKQFPMDQWKEMHVDDRCWAAKVIAREHVRAGRLRLARLAADRFCTSDRSLFEAYTIILEEYLDQQEPGG